jgi:hypothetical protein
MDKNRATITVKIGSPEKESTKAKNEVAVGQDPPSIENTFGPKYVPSYTTKTEEPVISKERKLIRPYKQWKDENRRNMWGIMVTALGAIAVGVIFGSIVLLFFKSGMMEQSASNSNKIISPTTIQSQGITGKQVPPSNPTKAAVQSNQSITIPAQSSFVIQAGVFSDEKSAQSVVSKIKAKGWPVEVIGQNPVHLFLGIVGTHDQANAIKSQFKDFDVYIKTFDTEAQTVSVKVKEGQSTSQAEWDQWAGVEEKFVADTNQAIVQAALNGKLADDTMKTVTAAHRDLLEKGRDLFNKLPDQSQSLGNHLLNDYSKMAAALERYSKQPSQGYLWQTEQSLLDSIKSKQQFLSSFH